jgi:hypothetical protein
MKHLKLCLTCHSVIATTQVTKGSLIIETLFWLLFILPGFIYSIWRLASRYEACSVCGAGNCVPLNTPAAQAILEEE